MSEVGERRSRRERKKPTQIYEVLDKRLTGDDDADAVLGDEDDVEESESNDDDDDGEADERQFVSPKPKPRARLNGASTRAAPAKRKSAALVQSRMLKPVQEAGNGKSTRKNSAGEGDSDEADEDAMFFGTIHCRIFGASMYVLFHSLCSDCSCDCSCNYVLQR